MDPAPAGPALRASTKETLQLFSEVIKAIGILTLVLFMVSAVAFPKQVSKWLETAGWKFDSVNIGPFKLVSLVNNTAKAGDAALRMADTLSEVEARLQAGEVSPASLQQMGELVRTARGTLTAQAQALKQSGRDLGLAERVPSEGWLYVGYYNEDWRLVRPYSRIGTASGVHVSGSLASGGRIEEIVLKHDAPVVSDGDDCSRPDVADVKMPGPDAKDIEYAIVGASEQPIKVLMTVACKAAGNGRQVYAKVAVPKDRVRFARLAQVL